MEYRACLLPPLRACTMPPVDNAAGCEFAMVIAISSSLPVSFYAPPQLRGLALCFCSSIITIFQSVSQSVIPSFAPNYSSHQYSNFLHLDTLLHRYNDQEIKHPLHDKASNSFGMEETTSRLTAHGSRLTAHGSRLTALGSRLSFPLDRLTETLRPLKCPHKLAS